MIRRIFFKQQKSFFIRFNSTKFENYPNILRDCISNYRSSFQKPENQHEVLSVPIKMLQELSSEEIDNIKSKEEYKSIFYELFRCLQDASFPKDSLDTVDKLVMDLYKAMKNFDNRDDEFLDVDMYNLVLDTFANFKSATFFNIVIMDMKDNQIPIDQETFKSMIKLAVNQRDYQKAMKICLVMKKMGFEVDKSVTSLIGGENPFMGM